jgi:hypothetical protein
MLGQDIFVSQAKVLNQGLLVVVCDKTNVHSYQPLKTKKTENNISQLYYSEKP